MRATLTLFVVFLILAVFLWVTSSGALFVLGMLFWLLLLVITVAYSDVALLYLLGAREVRASDEKIFFEAAAQEAYKLSLSTPRLYFYNGTLERSFILQKGRTTSLVLSKELLEKCSGPEMKAICFEMLLQVKRGMASKRTKAMFLLGLVTWLTHSVIGVLVSLIPFKEFRKTIYWFLNYLLHPFLSFMFSMILGKRYFKKLERYLADFPLEKELLDQVGLKLRKPFSYYSTPSRKLMELTSINKSKNFQSILALEFLPHEWDYLFVGEEIKRAE